MSQFTFNDNTNSKANADLILLELNSRIRYEYINQIMMNNVNREIDEMRQNNLNEQSNSFRARGVIFEAIENLTRVKKFVES